MKFKLFRAVPVFAGALAVACLAAGQSPQAIQMEQAARRAADSEARLQAARIQAFVDAWNDFVREWAEKGTYNMKKAKKVRKAWDDLDRSQFLPR